MELIHQNASHLTPHIQVNQHQKEACTKRKTHQAKKSNGLAHQQHKGINFVGTQSPLPQGSIERDCHCYHLNANGKAVARSVGEYPYSYEPFLTNRLLPQSQANSSVYSDRLYQWDSEKFNKLCLKHFGDQGQCFYDREVTKIEAFLREYNNKPELQLVSIEQGCHVSNGYPFWVFHYCT